MRCLEIATGIGALMLSASAQSVELSSLWPNPDGLRWDYELVVQHPITHSNSIVVGSLVLAGTIATPNGTFQLLHASRHASASESFVDPVVHAVWRARPDLRTAIEARYGKPSTTDPWGPLLLHGGYFVKGPSSIQMRQPGFSQPTWTYLRSDLTVGAAFVQPLLDGFSGDIFLHGTVESIDAAVTTPAGSFTNGVRMAYLVDYGQGELRNENGVVIGTYRSETTGHVTYVPDVGPVELLEQLIPYLEVDCGANACPPEIVERLGIVDQTITLSLQQSVGVAPTTWSNVKRLYRGTSR